MNKKTVYLYFFRSSYGGIETRTSGHQCVADYRDFDNFIGWQKVEIDLNTLEEGNG